MRPARLLAVLPSALLAVACTEQPLPEFRDPVPMSVPAEQPAIGPRLAQRDRDSAILSWMEKSGETPTLRFSRYDNGSWSEPATAATDEDMFVNWADLPAVTPTGPSTLLAHWLSRTGDAPYAYQVLTARSTDRGASWSDAASPHTDGTQTEHGFVSLYADPRGTGLIWLDGRNTPEAGMTLRGAVIADDGSLEQESELDRLVCDCCQTGVAVTGKGPVAVYRDRTGEEVRDIYVSRRIDGRWQAGTAIADDGWVIDGCPVNGPAIAAVDELVVVAWFTAANDAPVVKAAVSKNAGRSFSAPVDISVNNPLGHVGLAIVDERSYAVSWLEPDRSGTNAILVRGLATDGRMGPVNTVGRTALTRAVPQMLRVGDKLVLAWTDEMNGLTKVASVKVAIAGFYD